jgi:hypothetical protein
MAQQASLPEASSPRSAIVMGGDGAVQAVAAPADTLLPRTHATLFGIGRINELDTYLSPQEYTGTQFSVQRQHTRATRLRNLPLEMENLLQGTFSYTKSPTEDGKNISGMVHWGFSWRYRWQVADRLTLALGPGAAIHGGFCYNTRNGNNPAQARLNADINAVGTATWKVRLCHKDLTLHYRAELPLLGLMFSPNYGQSYYEIFSLGHYDHNVCLTHPFQAFSIDQMLTADLPLGSQLLRMGYLFTMRQYQVNHLKQHAWCHTFLLGYVKHFYLVKPRRSAPNR